MNMVKRLAAVANKIDAKGLHSVASEIDCFVEEYMAEYDVDTGPSLEESVDEHLRTLESLAQIANKLDREGFSVFAEQIDGILELDAMKSQSAIDAVLSIYQAKHRVASIQNFTKRSNVRKDTLPAEQRCPFGLSIPGGCSKVGPLIVEMEPGEENFGKNRAMFERFRPVDERGENTEGIECPFAARIFEKKNAVNCTHGTPMAGVELPEIYHGSPIYPKLFEGFNTVNLDRSYYQYRDFGNYSFYG